MRKGDLKREDMRSDTDKLESNIANRLRTYEQ
jgi:hypothetical protein